MAVRESLLLSFALLGCSAPPAPSAGPAGAAKTSEPSPPDEVAFADPPSEADAGPSATTAAEDDAVEARVVDSGPIGDGSCTQCSHQIVVEARISGSIAAGPEPLWVHYERCEGDPPPDPASFNPCSMKKGTAYTLTLRRGASVNFGDEPMIVSARPR